MQSLVKTLTLCIIAISINLPAFSALEGVGPGPEIEQQSQYGTTHEKTHEITQEPALLAAANFPVKQAGTMQHTLPTQLSKTSLHKHTKTHPAAILLLVMAIAGVFLFPALMERCSPSWVVQFKAPSRG